MILTLYGPTVVHSNSSSPYDHPRNVVSTFVICGGAGRVARRRRWVVTGVLSAHHCVHVIVGGAPVVAGDHAVVPRVGCSSRIGGADDHHDRGLLPLDDGVIGVSEAQLPPPLLREALDERNRGCGVLDSHVALASSVALRWERGIRQHRAAAHVRPRQHEVVVHEAPDDGHGTSG
eukprot:scaffold1013_cov74-Phaeocystis_antarctica.AAC.3